MTKIFIDSSYFIRLLIRDTESQFLISKELFEQIEKDEIVGVTSLLSVIDIVESLENYYLIPREHYVPVLLKLFSFRSMRFIDIKKNLLFGILEDFSKLNLDFVQCYIRKVKGDKELVSFDKNLLRSI